MASTEKDGAKAPFTARPQYHYFYGSIDNTTDTESVGNVDSPMATDQDSLVGESLITTDNEQEDDAPYGHLQDFRQLLVTNGNHLVSIKELEVANHHKPWYRSLLRDLRCGGNPLLHVCFLVGGLSITLFIAAVLMFPGKDASATIPLPMSELKFRMPFPRIDRGDYDDPVESIINKDLFHPSMLNAGERSPRRIFNFPFPTGAFWTNLVLGPTADRGLSYPVSVYPYAYSWNEEMLQVSYPAKHRREDPKAIHDYYFPDLSFSCAEGGQKRLITGFDALSVSLEYTAKNDGVWRTWLVQGSPYVTIQYVNTSPYIRAFTTFTNIMCPRDGEGNSNLVAGNITRRQRRQLKYGVCYTATDPNNSNSKSIRLHGVQFILQTPEGMNWMVFTSDPITLIYDAVRQTTVVSPEPFNGVMRLAHIPTALFNNAEGYIDVSSSSGLQRLINHASAYPTSGTVSWSFRNSVQESNLVTAAKVITGFSTKAVAAAAAVKDSMTSSTDQPVATTSTRLGTLTFDFGVASFAPPSSAVTVPSLLMLALPHHVARLPQGMQLEHGNFDLVYLCIKGPMKPVLGSSWSYDEPLYSLGFDNDSGSSKDASYLQPAVRNKIIKSLAEDIDLALPTLNENIYGFGKQSARLAQLAHVSRKLIISSNNRSSTDNSTSSDDANNEVIQLLHNRSVEILSFSLKQLLSGNTTDMLLYDENLGGMITSDGARDPGADFGNGRYNDHHFHYGYILYACAILGRLDDSFVKEYGNRVDTLFYDVAHNANFNSQSSDGVFFPGARHKLWFDGHSFASGLFPFANGKSQESSSEAVNCYFGAYLWSLIRHGAGESPEADTTTQTDFARLLLATEITGARTYWHMTPPASVNQTGTALSVYTPSFSKNYMVGNLVSQRIAYSLYVSATDVCSLLWSCWLTFVVLR
jgi:endoglucanase Acf2